MKTIPLTRDKVAIVDDADYERLSQFIWTANSTVRRGRTIWRACRWVGGRENRRVIHMHREILSVIDPKVVVDHINGDDLDNRRANLRTCTHQQNLRNQHTTIGNSGFKGVRFHSRLTSRPFSAQIVIDYRTQHIGYFATAKEAAHAYDESARWLFGEFARCNFEQEAPAEMDVDLHDVVERQTSRIVRP